MIHRRTVGRGQVACFSLPPQLQKPLGEKAQRQMGVQAAPRVPIKMLQSEFLFELLVPLLNLPPLLRPVEERADRGAAEGITQIILVPSIAVTLNQQPAFRSRTAPYLPNGYAMVSAKALPERDTETAEMFQNAGEERRETRQSP